MTLVIGATLSKGAWVLTDRRVSFRARPPIDDAVKVFEFTRRGESAVFAYAGLGMTVGGLEPSEWFRRIARGMRRNVTLEECARVFAAVMNEELPKHLQSLTWTSKVVDHGVLCLAVVDGKPRAYAFEMRVEAGGSQHSFVVRETKFDGLTRTPVCIFVGGSGARHVKRRELLHLFQAFDKGRISEESVADRLAVICHRVHSLEPTVGRNSIVCRVAPMASTRHFSYEGTKRRPDGTVKIPMILEGLDLFAITEHVQAQFLSRTEKHREKLMALSKAGDREAWIKASQEAMSEAMEGDVFNEAYRATWKPSDTSLK